MQKWLDLLTPPAAAVAILVALALLVVNIRQGRAIRRLEDRVADTDGAAARVSLDRLQALGKRARTSTSVRPAPVIGVVVAALVLIAAGWFMFGSDSDSESAGSGTTTSSSDGTTIDQIRTAPDPNPEALEPSKAAFKILVLNGSGVSGAAGSGVNPVVASMGYAIAQADNATRNDFDQSVVVELPGKETVADNIAKDLGITRLMSQDGVVPPGYDLTGIDAIVIVGKDLAAQYRP